MGWAGVVQVERADLRENVRLVPTIRGVNLSPTTRVESGGFYIELFC